MPSPESSRRRDKDNGFADGEAAGALLEVTADGRGASTALAGARERRPRNLLLVIGALLLLCVLLAAALLQFSVLVQPCLHKSEGHEDLCLTEECVRTAATLLAAMDRSADPCEDFYQYACGDWNKAHSIPEDKASTSTFEVLADQLQLTLKGVLETPVTAEDCEATIKAKTFYNTCMNVSEIRAASDGGLREVLRSLGGWPVVEGASWQPPRLSIEQLLGRLRRIYNEGVLVEMFVGPDDKNSSINIIQLDQITLPLARDYYLKSASAGDIAAYLAYMTRIAELLGASPERAGDELRHVVEFEKRLANVSVPEADRLDAGAIYSRLPLAALAARVPQLAWAEYLRAALDAPLAADEPVVTYVMDYFVDMGRIVNDTDVRTLYNYALWRLVLSLTPHMLGGYQAAGAEFRRVLQGVQAERSRWTVCVEWTNKKFAVAVGALFVKDHFNHESKEVALNMIYTIREAFNELLAHNDWMDDETRAVAKQKADAISERIGYPEMLTRPHQLNAEYSNLTISSSDLFANVLAVAEHEARRNLQLLGQPVDRDKWTTEPAVVNAFYNPNRNEIVFPAGILQPLFYSKHFPKSLNYGGIGVVIGHEITHGFDDKGRQYDKDGNMMQWWNNATVLAFRRRTQCIIDQYSEYKIKEIGHNINGRLTQGENIADNGGLKQSFRAYKKWVSQHGPEPALPGLNLTHDQLFFLNYAQIWCGSMRPEDALSKVRSSVHSPGPVRVLGPLSNSRDFAEAYNCPLGSKMNPEQKCSVW